MAAMIDVSVGVCGCVSVSLLLALLFDIGGGVDDGMAAAQHRRRESASDPP